MAKPRWQRGAVREAALGPGMRALDIACGTGQLTAELHRAVVPGGLRTSDQSVDCERLILE